MVSRSTAQCAFSSHTLRSDPAPPWWPRVTVREVGAMPPPISLPSTSSNGSHGAHDLGLPHHRLVLHDHRRRCWSTGRSGCSERRRVWGMTFRDVLGRPESPFVEFVGIDERELRHRGTHRGRAHPGAGRRSARHILSIQGSDVSELGSIGENAGEYTLGQCA